MAMLQQTMLQHQLVAAAGLQQGTDQSTAALQQTMLQHQLAAAAGLQQGTDQSTAALQQTMLQHQLAAAAGLQQGTDQSTATLQHAQAKAAAAAAALQLPAYHAYQTSPAIIPLALQTALNPRLALSNQALLAALVNSPGALANFGQLGSTAGMPATSSSGVGVNTSPSDEPDKTVAQGDEGQYVASPSKTNKGSASRKSWRGSDSHGARNSKSKTHTAKSLHLPCTVGEEQDSNTEQEEDELEQTSHQNGDSPASVSPVPSGDESEDETQSVDEPADEPPPKKSKVSGSAAHTGMAVNSDLQ
jgi:hypothetical protein